MLFEYLNQQQIVQSADAGRRKIRFMLAAELVRGQKWMLCDIVYCEMCVHDKVIFFLNTCCFVVAYSASNKGS